MTAAERRLASGGIARLVLVLAALVALAAARVALGQASEAEMSAFPMPPPSGYHATKTFGYVGDYGYYTAPSARPGATANPADYTYVRYLGVRGKKVYLYGAWGPSSIPPPTGGGDACGHTHASYGVWARWSLGLPWLFRTFEGWYLAGGGGMSGQRDASGKCVHRTDNPLGAFDPRFGWGDDFEVFDLRGFTFVRELVLGALSNTHGWGTCTVPPATFPACVEPSYLIGYTLP
jgi:hypothetical protein